MAAQRKKECLVCLNIVPMDDFFSLSCGHSNVCKSCWIDYLLYGVKTKQCLNCPTFECYEVILPNIWQLFLSNNYQNEYYRYCSMTIPIDSNAKCNLCENEFVCINKQYNFGEHCNYCLSKLIEYKFKQEDDVLFISIATKNNQQTMKVTLSEYTPKELNELLNTKIFKSITSDNCKDFSNVEQVRHDLNHLIRMTKKQRIDDFLQSLEPQVLMKYLLSCLIN